MKFRAYKNGTVREFYADRVCVVEKKETTISPKRMSRDERFTMIKKWVIENKMDLTLDWDRDAEEFLEIARKSKVDGIYSSNTFLPDIARNLSKTFRKIKNEQN